MTTRNLYRCENEHCGVELHSSFTGKTWGTCKECGSAFMRRVDATPPEPADTEAAAVWERLSKAQRAAVVGGEPDWRAASNATWGALRRIGVASTTHDGLGRRGLTDLGRRVAEHGRKAGGR